MTKKCGRGLQKLRGTLKSIPYKSECDSGLITTQDHGSIYNIVSEMYKKVRNVTSKNQCNITNKIGDDI